MSWAGKVFGPQRCTSPGWPSSGGFGTLAVGCPSLRGAEACGRGKLGFSRRIHPKPTSLLAIVPGSAGRNQAPEGLVGSGGVGVKRLRTAGQVSKEQTGAKPNPAAPGERGRLHIGLFICRKASATSWSGCPHHAGRDRRLQASKTPVSGRRPGIHRDGARCRTANRCIRTGKGYWHPGH